MVLNDYTQLTIGQGRMTFAGGPKIVNTVSPEKYVCGGGVVGRECGGL